MQQSKAELDVGLTTLDARAAVKFYRELMGLEELAPAWMGASGIQARVRVGGHTLELYQFAEPPAPCMGGTERANGMRLLAFILDDLESVLERFDAVGHPYDRMRLPDRSAFDVAFSEDTDGNVLELVGLRRPAGPGYTARMQIGLTVGDVERSRRFYGTLLGLREEPKMKLPRAMGVIGDARYGFIAGQTTIKFWSYGPELPTETGAPAKRTGIRLMKVMVDDVDAAHEELRGRGVPIKVEPYDFEGRARIMFIADPDGNWIELAEPR